MAKTQKVIQYKVIVDGLLIGGHPVCYLEFHLNSACKIMDKLCETYPHRIVRMFSLIEEEIKVCAGKPQPMAICPRGHSGRDWNGNDIVHSNGRGMLVCSVCGWVGEDKRL